MRGWVYFARSGIQGPIKIGHALDVQQRLINLSIASPVEVVLLGAFLSENAEADEKHIHQKLAPYRIKGEWFQAEGALAEMQTHAIVGPTQVFKIESLRDSRKECIKIRLTADEAFAWQAAAEKDNISLSEWLRRLGNAEAEEVGSAADPL
jgi:hypothetical protein